MSYIKSFSELGKDDALIAGGKGASLGEMTQAGIPVPNGFVILASAFERFLEETDLGVEIDAILRTVNKSEMRSVEHASEKIQHLILNAKMPSGISTDVQKHFDQLGTEYVAVRSSATAEDSASAAWAGQLESYLNTNVNTLLENVQRCWASLFTPRAIFYRFEKDLHTTKISVAVVVQKMVSSELSGVAFSVHPITEDKNQLIIEAGYGLGEAIVAGQITPDSYVVEKEPRRVTDVNTNTQKKALYRATGGGNEWQDIVEPRASSQVLTSEQILQLAELVIRIEEHYGFACDIEWAFENNTFYIVQSRPITTLSNIKKEARKPLFKINVSRDMALATFEVWVKSDTEKLNNWIGITTERIILENKAGVITAYENEKIFEDAGLALKKLLTDNNWLPQKLKEYKENIALVKKYSDTLIATPSREAFEALFELLAITQGGLAIVYFVPTIEGIGEAEKQLCLKERELTEKFFYDANSILESGIALIYPELKEYVNVLSFKEIISGNIPTRAILDERKKYFIYYDEMFHSHSSLNDVEKELSISIERKAKAESEIRGTVAFSGTAKGPAVIVLRRSDLHKVKTGDVMVCAMTNPDFLPAMHKAIAFVTDEGGITSHAAITAREMKKPCVIGTKIATESIKDGDVIEVDADQGVVRILKAENIFGSIDEWQRLFRVQGLRFLIDDLWMEHYKTLGALTVIINDEYTSYLPHKVMKQTLADGTELISDAIQFEQYETEFRAYMTKLQTYAQSLDFDIASKEESLHLLDEIARLFSYYSKTEFFSTDGAYKLFEETKDKGIEKRLEQMGQIKNDGRSFLNSIFFGSDAVLPKLLKAFEQRFGVSERNLQQYSQEEILGLFDGKTVAIDAIERRNEAFYIWSNNGKLIIKTGIDAKRDIQAFVGEATREHSETIAGTSAHTGRVRGPARIIRAGYDNFDVLHHLMDAMQNGDILVAETTSPELMPACQKAGGIITDQGGMLSHAAIVSRELNIPCVVGTSNATEAIKDGDIVEVNGDKGMIYIVSRS